MLANYGYQDGSGDWFITVDTERCDGCGRCVAQCPNHVLEITRDDYEEEVAAVRKKSRQSIKYECGPCGPERPCVTVCGPAALTFSW